MASKTYLGEPKAIRLLSKSASLVLALFILALPGKALIAEVAEIENPSDSNVVQVSESESTETAVAIPLIEEDISIPQEESFTSMAAAQASINDEGEVTQTATAGANTLNNIRVQSNTGALDYSFEITVPPARGFYQPIVKLEYNSQFLTDMSPLGYGWGISIPYIERTNKLGVNALYSTTSSYFMSSISGELAQIGTSTKFSAKIEKGDFIQYDFSNNVWVATDKNGTKYTFGSTSSSRQDDPTNNTRIYKWMLDKVEDTNGNITVYTYSKHLGVIYPLQINYTNTSSSSGLYKVKFSTSTTATSTSFQTGFKSERSYVVNAVSVFVNDQLSRAFNLRYQSGTNDRRTLLAGVTEIGYTHSSTTTLPEVVFSYDGDQLPAWSEPTSASFPEPMGKQDLGVRFGDLNGDGLTDIVRYYQKEGDGYHTTIKRVHINKGDGTWDINVPWGWDDIQVPFAYWQDEVFSNTSGTFDLGTRLIDVNGDGRSDITVGYGCIKLGTWCDVPSLVPLPQSGVYINTGSGFVKDTSWNPPILASWHEDKSRPHNNATAVVDVNGDGLPDVVSSAFYTYDYNHPSLNTSSIILLNTGTFWATSTMVFPAPLGMKASNVSGYRGFDDAGTRLADVNGDGLIDILRGFDASATQYNPEQDEKSVYINTGSGWSTSSIYALPINFVEPGGGSVTQGYDVFDVNGDGLPEIIRAQSHNGEFYEFYSNNGRGWDEIYYELPFFLTYDYRKYNTGVGIIDFDGDTIADGWNMNYVESFPTQSSGGSVIINNAKIPDLLTNIKTETNGEIAIKYDGYLDKVQGSYGSVGTSSNNIVVVSETRFKPGDGSSWSKTYDYSRGYLSYASTSIRDRKFAGFESVTQTGDLDKITTFYHQGNGNSVDESSDSYLKIGLPYRVDISDLSNDVYKKTLTKWDTQTSATNTGYAYASRQLVKQYDGDGDSKDTGTEFTYTIYGNPGVVTEYGEVSGNSDGTFTDIGTDKRITQYSYATNTTAYIVGLPSAEVVKDQNGTKIRESRYYYDSQSLGTVTKGNRTKEESWISGSLYASSTRSYNSLGLVTTETNPRGKTTTHIYDTYNLYPATTTNPLSQSTRYQYDYSSGKVATTTDPNGEMYVTVFDGLDRPLLERIPDPQSGALVTKSEYVYTDTLGNVNVKKVNYLNSATSTTEYNYLDGFGRTVQQRIEMEDSNKFSVKDYYYGASGLLAKESLPYESTGASSTASTSVTNLYTTYAYDPLDRVTLVTSAVGDTATNYDQWTHTVTDALNNEKDYIYDAYGRLTQVKEHLGTSTYTTTYDWNGNDSLTKITDALGNVRNITYDALGRRLTLEDLHAAGDTTFGTWTFTYDLASNVSTTTNPKGQVIGRTYDSLNRPLTENYTGQAGTEVTFTYDSCTKGVGRLCSSLNSSGTTTYAYNRLGQVATATRAIGTSTYTSRYEYDRQGNQIRVVYPDNSEVTYQYNKAGKLELVHQKESGGAWKNIITNLNYGPHGMITYQLLGNGASTTKIYDANALYRLSSILTMATSSYGTGGPGAELALLEEALTLELQFEEATLETTPDQEIGLLSEILIEEIQPEVTLSEDVSDESLVTAPLEETILVEDPSDPTVLLPTESDIPVIIDEFSVATGTTATNTMAYAEDTASSTTAELIMPIETVPELASSTDMLPVLVEELKPKKRDTDKLIKSARDAQLWQKFLKERAAGIREAKDAPQEAVVAADYALDQFEGYLVEKGYVEAKGVEVKPSAKEKIQGALKKVVDEVISFILPESVYAFLFGVEDFENCSSLPCSFSNVVTWGSVTQSLDATSKVAGADSLKEVVTGEGEGSVESINHNEDEVWVQFKIFVPSNMAWGPSGYFSVLNLEDSSNSNIFWLAIEDWGTPRLTMAGDTLSWTDTGITLTEGAVNTIELRFKKGASTGDVDIWHNNTNAGSPTYNGSGTMNTGTDNVDDIRIGMTYSPESGISTTYYDNITIDTVFIGEPAPAGTEPFVAKVQDLKYTYDAVGNITTVVDASQTKTAATTSYQYDDLYRLTRASTTKASTTPYVQTYTYNAIGNLITKSDIGAYEYDGNASSDITLPIYTDTIASGWSDWSWSTTLNPSNASPVANGTYSLRATYASAWAGLGLHVNSLNASSYTSLDLKVNVGTSTNTDLYLYFMDANENLIQAVSIEDYIVGDFATSTWHTVSIPLTHLDMEVYSGVTTLGIESSVTATVYFDDIKFVGTSGAANYANPHAATVINGISYTYDQNGNLATTSTGHINIWNYQNRLTESRGGGVATTTYTYDADGQRTTKTSGGVTTKYPFSFYEQTGTSTTKHIYAGDELIATVKSDTPAPKVYYNHLDHLGGTAAVSTADGYLSQELSYYPFGAMRVDEQYGQIDQSRRFTGHEYDDETDLSYMGARYYDGQTGRFASQDPVSLALGNASTQNLMTEESYENYLRDPQGHNTYSYSRNNPILFVDKNGEWFKEFATGQQSFTDFQIEVGQATKYMTDNSKAWDYAVSNPKTAGAIVAAASIPALQSAAAAGVAVTGGVLAEGIGLTTALTRLAGASVYGYLAQDQLTDTIPSVFDAVGGIDANGMNASDVGSLTWDVGTSFVPGIISNSFGVIGQNIGATMELTDFTYSVADQAIPENPRRQEQDRNN